MEKLWQDIRYGIRTLMKSPGFSVVAVLTLALGIGANAAIFSMVDWILIRPLPVQNPDQITVLAFQQKSGPLQTNFSIAEFRDIVDQTGGAFSELFGYEFGLDGVSENGKAERILTSYVTGNYFTTLGVKPAIGRLILPSEGNSPGADPVLVLAYSYWKSRFGADPGVIGRKVSVDGHPVTIVGVAPEGFHGVSVILDIQGYLPLGMASVGGYPPDFMTNRDLRNLAVLGRLRPGTTLKQAAASLKVVAQRLSEQYPQSDKDLMINVYPERLARPNPDPDNFILKVSGLFLALAALVLLLACVNVANILLVRATVRQREMAIRAALGAGRGRLIRQLLTESVVLALAGGAAGILLGVWASGMLASVHLQTDLPFYLNFSFDWRVFAYAFAAALLTGVIVGIVPAIRASRGNLSAILHEGGRGVFSGRHRLRSALVVAQVGGSLTLLIIAGLFTRSLAKAQRADLGFDPNHVLNLTMDPNQIGYNESQGRAFYKELLSRVRALPGVESASLALAVPMGYYSNGDTLHIEGYQLPAGQPEPTVAYNVVSPGYFETMRIPLIRGREFADADEQGAQHVAIVNETMAKTFWPQGDPIGRRFQMASDPKRSIQIVGVAKDSRYSGVASSIHAYFYVPLAQNYKTNSLETLQVRTRMAPETMIPEAEKEIESLAPDLPVFDVKTMLEGLDTLNGLLIFQLGAVLAGALGMMGLILAVVGVYGVVSYSASQRTHEIGIRMALGAQRLDISKMVLRQGLFIIGIGLAFGLLAAFAAARLVGNFLVAVSGTDPFTYVGVSVGLALVALAACYIPARRAMSVDPMVALRHE